MEEENCDVNELEAKVKPMPEVRAISVVKSKVQVRAMKGMKPNYLVRAIHEVKPNAGLRNQRQGEPQ